MIEMDQWQTLLERFLRNECSERENKIVFYALRDGLIDDEFRHAIDLVMNDRDATAQIDRMEPVSDDVLNNIRFRMQKTEEKPAGGKSALREWLKIAAVAIITLSVSWMVFHSKTPDKPRPEAALNTIRVPAGQTVNLTLADGTNIWLNARSTLQYPGVFSGNKRELFLEGEGFFDVAHNPEKPFVVHAGGYDIRALGTQFNVEAYSNGAGFNTSLLDGAVRITSAGDTLQTIVLQPNTMARLHDGRLIAENITDFNHYRWREGLICFDNMPFTILMTEFEKCYGIKIVVENSRVKNYAPTGKFRKSDGVDYALRVLQRNFRFVFERDEENHIIYIK
jgi:ferric-dicitrate binding protein FerR (iron transport regulator)